MCTIHHRQMLRQRGAYPSIQSIGWYTTLLYLMEGIDPAIPYNDALQFIGNVPSCHVLVVVKYSSSKVRDICTRVALSCQIELQSKEVSMA